MMDLSPEIVVLIKYRSLRSDGVAGDWSGQLSSGAVVNTAH